MHFGVLSIFQNYRDEHSDTEIVEGELALARLAEETAFDSYLYGSPDEIAAQLRQQKEILGVDHDVLVMPKYGSMTQAEAEASMGLFAREVIPKM